MYFLFFGADMETPAMIPKGSPLDLAGSAVHRANWHLSDSAALVYQ